jgi:predicted RNase H-like nuclease (RuvC/YqgF family)
MNTATLEKEFAEILDIPKVNNLPAPVHRFVNDVNKNFNGTVDALRERARELRRAAEELEDRADKLAAAGPYLRKEIEDWISFERECSVRQQSLALVEQK